MEKSVSLNNEYYPGHGTKMSYNGLLIMFVLVTSYH